MFIIWTGKDKMQLSSSSTIRFQHLTLRAALNGAAPAEMAGILLAVWPHEDRILQNITIYNLRAFIRCRRLSGLCVPHDRPYFVSV